MLVACRYTGRDRWYVQEQMEILYLPLEWNYCTVAAYNILAEDTGTGKKNRIPRNRHFAAHVAPAVS